MGVCCDLEVDVNGEATFMVEKEILFSFSCRLRKLVQTTAGLTSRLKVVLHSFPGGSEGFELIARFCYNGGKVDITPTNAVLLHFAANYLDIEDPETQLIIEIENFLQGVNFWSWPELLLALKQCQTCLQTRKDSFIAQKLLDCLVSKLGLIRCASTSTSSSESSSFRYSYDTRSHESVRSKFSPITWWFQDLVFLNPNMLEKLIKMMISQNLDHKIIFKFLFYYRKSRCCHSKLGEKQKTTECVVALLTLLDPSSPSCKGIFDIYQAALSLKINRKSEGKLEILMGLQLDRLTVSHLLFPAPGREDYVYDVNLVLRLVKIFQTEYRFCSSLCKFEKVGRLMDSYLMEVAPDSHLKASKFVALAMALPQSTRETHDRLYQAIDMYFQLHAELREDEKIRICSALNYSKLSTEALKHLAQNPKFPCRRRAAKSLISKQSNSIHLFCDTMITKIIRDSPFARTANRNEQKVMNQKAITTERITATICASIR